MTPRPPVIQIYSTPGTESCLFRDLYENRHTNRCQPRDIQLIDMPNDDKPGRDLREAICIDVRLGQGESHIGVAKNMKWS